MDALVLTYDKYHCFARHMIAAYDQLIPGHGLRFIVPYQADRQAFAPLQRPPEFVPSPPGILDTVSTLLAGRDDEAWVYWAIDDKYPERIDATAFHQTMTMVRANLDADALLFCRPISQYLSRNLKSGVADWVDPQGRYYYQRASFSQIWMHQFVRVKVLRYLFGSFPHTEFAAKAMDGYKDRIRLPSQWRLLGARRGWAVFGESTTRGRVTNNCLASMRGYGISLPDDFPSSGKTMRLGAESFDNRRLRIAIEAAARTLVRAACKRRRINLVGR